MQTFLADCRWFKRKSVPYINCFVWEENNLKMKGAILNNLCECHMCESNAAG